MNKLTRETLKQYKGLSETDQQIVLTETTHAMLDAATGTENQMIEEIMEQLNLSLPRGMKLTKVEAATLLMQVGIWMAKH